MKTKLILFCGALAFSLQVSNSFAQSGNVGSGYDPEATQLVPPAIIEFTRSQQTKNSNLVLTANGILNLKSTQPSNQANLIQGTYLKNGDYLLTMQHWTKVKGAIGNETIKIKRRGGPNFNATLVYSPEMGIKSIETQSDENDSTSDQTPIKIKVNGVLYQNNYLKAFE
jgi:hypothetical protein